MAVDWSSVDTARTNATNAANTALDYSAKSNTLADELRKAVGERYGESGMAQNTAKARTDFMAAAPQARADVLGMVQGGSILSPTQQNAILAAKRGSALMPLMGQNLVNNAAFGTIEDLINAGTNAWNAKTQAAQGSAQIAQTGYSSLLNELLQKAQEDRAAQTQQWNEQLQPLQLEQLKAQIAATNRSNQGGGGSTSYTPVELNGQMYNYNPRTGEYIKANVQGGKSKYGQQDIVDFANAVNDGRATLTGVPSEIRGQVNTVLQQIEAAKPWYEQPWFGLGNLFK